MTNLEMIDEKQYPQIRWENDFMNIQHDRIGNLYSPQPLPPRQLIPGPLYQPKQRVVSPQSNQFLAKKLPYHSQSSPFYYYQYDKQNKIITPPSSSSFLSPRPVIYQQLIPQQNSPFNNGNNNIPARFIQDYKNNEAVSQSFYSIFHSINKYFIINYVD